MDMLTCKSCKAFALIGGKNALGEEVGACVRHPPIPQCVPVMGEDGKPVVDFTYVRPMTNENGTCCEHLEISHIIPANTMPTGPVLVP